ncbi:MAG: FliM/FliN family flagellar motor switch protein [Candidatus Poribacteria bacterium]|jgi:flagellar motor switch protein FliN/FliY|nr:FliM/FliN family flagellar motor switch protein [Candidatus Poribacteria bacterium]MDP6751773.1 FliM/FliN family flagellar motor switch protein [Candidatus Poribacteria bacterium]MDP6960510.1 FliM/FliN family flagellar motor switch protein [Dehalococcoidia bacterium]
MNEANIPEQDEIQATNLAHLTRVPVEVTVELGRAERSIKDILELGAGSLIELESVVGEPVDLLVNGQFFAKGEVIAIEEETYGIKITNIISEDEKMNRLSEML